jgi:hypothetical protein
MSGSSFLRIWLWGGCSEIVKRSEVVLVANDSIAGYERGRHKIDPELSDSKIRPRHLTQDAFCFAASEPLKVTSLSAHRIRWPRRSHQCKKPMGKPNHPAAANLAATSGCHAESQWREVAGQEPSHADLNRALSNAVV